MDLSVLKRLEGYQGKEVSISLRGLESYQQPEGVTWHQRETDEMTFIYHCLLPMPLYHDPQTDRMVRRTPEAYQGNRSDVDFFVGDFVMAGTGLSGEKIFLPLFDIEGEVSDQRQRYRLVTRVGAEDRDVLRAKVNVRDGDESVEYCLQ